MIWILVACVLGAAAVLITHRAAGDMTLTRIIGASFVIRGLAAVVLFFVSSLKLPLLRSAQLDHGLWVFGADGVSYHTQALQILDSWRGVAPMPALDPSVMPSLWMATVYAVFGASPLNFILVNAWLGAIAGLLAYLIAARLGDRRAALPAAALVAFWPSSILWSTQLLKDPAVIALELCALLLLVTLWQRYASPEVEPNRAVFVDIARWVGLFVAVFSTAAFRPHVGLALTVAVIAILATALGRALLRNRWRESVAALGITAVVGTATLASATLDLAPLLSTSSPSSLNSQSAAQQDPHRVAESSAPSSNVVAPAVSEKAVAVSPPTPVRPISSRWKSRLQAGLSWFSVDDLAETRRVQVIAEGGSLIDTTTFDGLGSIVAYLPQGIAYAYLAPFPWQLMSSGGHTGMMRPMSAVEIVLIALLVPSILIGCWKRARRFWPEEWMVLAFIVCLAIGYGVMVPNGGTLFRARLQFLFPSLILASSALPAFAYRLFNR